MTVSAKVQGMHELQTILRTLPDKVAKKILRPAARRAAKVVQAYAMATAPVDTGAMSRGIVVRASAGRKRRSRRKRVGAHVLYPPRDKLGIDPQSRWYYPAILEYGSANRNLPARPTLRTSLIETKAQTTGIFRDELSRRIVLLAKSSTKE